MSIKYNNKTIAGNYKSQVTPSADTVNKGIIKIATEAEVTAGTSNTTAVTPLYLKKKQNVLIAGSGIKIENNTISCTQGGVELGTILCIPFGVDESENKYRYLNGQTISQGSFTAFTAKLRTWTGVKPNLFTTEAKWQAEKKASKLGQCGKFVIDDTAGTIRLPLVININSLTDLTKAGVIKSESLPNITGGDLFYENGFTNFEGAIYSSGTGVGSKGSIDYDNPVGKFDASRSSSTYQNNAPVQQEAVQYPYVICVNSSVEEAERPINNYQVNNVYSYGMNQYYNGTMNNNSWLKSAGQWNSGATYNGLYQWILTKANANTAGFKLSTATYGDYDFVINTTNKTFRLPLLNGDESLPDNSSDKITTQTFSASNPYTATERVFVTGSALTGGGGSAYYSQVLLNGKVISREEGDFASFQLILNKGDILTTTGTATDKNAQINIAPVVGNGTLYYYVGDTLQNAGLINVATMSESIANINAKPHIVETYVKGTSGYRLYSDKYIEQWGSSDSLNPDAKQTITILKQMANTDYHVLIDRLTANNYTPQAINRTATTFVIQNNGTANVASKLLWTVLGYAK